MLAITPHGGHGGSGGGHHGGGHPVGGGARGGRGRGWGYEVIDVGCPMVYDPVTGSDGLVYDNACLAESAGVAVVKSAGLLARGLGAIRRARSAGTCPSGCWPVRDRAGNVTCDCNFVSGGAMALRGLGDTPPPDPAFPPPVPPEVQTLKVQAISIWNALLIGTVTGFAVAFGTVAFSRLARRVTGHEVVKTA